MSDCLAGHEGQSISEEEDEKLQRPGFGLPPALDPMEKSESNILPLATDHPRYRALRHPRQVMKDLDSQERPGLSEPPEGSSTPRSKPGARGRFTGGSR